MNSTNHPPASGPESNQILHTARLTLRRLTLEDARFVLELLNEPDFLNFIGDRGVRSVEDAKGYISRTAISAYERYGYGMLLVGTKETGESVGICGLIRREFLEDAEIGFAIHSKFGGLGFASEAAAAVMNYGLRELKLDRIVAIVTGDNVRSIRVLEKSGLEFEKKITWPDDGTELDLYAFPLPRNR